MKTSTAGINLIKKFEGCRLNAYKPVPTENTGLSDTDIMART